MASEIIVGNLVYTVEYRVLADKAMRDKAAAERGLAPSGGGGGNGSNPSAQNISAPMAGSFGGRGGGGYPALPVAGGFGGNGGPPSSSGNIGYGPGHIIPNGPAGSHPGNSFYNGDLRSRMPMGPGHLIPRGPIGGGGGINGFGNMAVPGPGLLEQIRQAGQTQVMGTGMFMNFLFGGWEVNTAFNSAASAGRFARANPTDLTGQLGAYNKALDKMTSGPLGSLVGTFTQGVRDNIDANAASAKRQDERGKTMVDDYYARQELQMSRESMRTRDKMNKSMIDLDISYRNEKRDVEDKFKARRAASLQRRDDVISAADPMRSARGLIAEGLQTPGATILTGGISPSIGQMLMPGANGQAAITAGIEYKRSIDMLAAQEAAEGRTLLNRGLSQPGGAPSRGVLGQSEMGGLIERNGMLAFLNKQSGGGAMSLDDELALKSAQMAAKRVGMPQLSALAQEEVDNALLRGMRGDQSRNDTLDRMADSTGRAVTNLQTSAMAFGSTIDPLTGRRIQDPRRTQLRGQAIAEGIKGVNAYDIAANQRTPEAIANAETRGRDRINELHLRELQIQESIRNRDEDVLRGGGSFGSSNPLGVNYMGGTTKNPDPQLEQLHQDLQEVKAALQNL